MANVSIIIPVYKAELYLRQCLDSVIAQTLPELEIILVDDGSPDGCGAICDEYAQKDGRVKVIHKANGGVVAAINTGLAAATGAYVGFVDSDDWIDPGYFEDLYRGVTDHGADVAQAERVEEFGPGRSQVHTQPETVVYEGRDGIGRLMEMFFTLFRYDHSKRPITYGRWDKLYKKELLLDNLRFFDHHLYLHEDTIVNAAVLPDCRKVVVMSGTAKYHYRILPASNSHRNDVDELEKVAQLHRILTSIAKEKGVDAGLVDLFTGYASYIRINMTAADSAPDIKTRSRNVKKILANTPPGVLQKYARFQGSILLRLYCWMLCAGAADLYVLAVRLYLLIRGNREASL